MRRLRIAMTIIGLIVSIVLLAGCGQSGSALSSTGFASRTMTVGSVEVTIEPLRLDDTGANFRVKLDTHSGDLGLDLAQAARLEVDGTDWGGASWVGDPPGGHHRQGELRFVSGGPARGEVRLTIAGLPQPVLATWKMPTG